MDRYSISDLARLSGVRPFTIRIWEKRYNALHPDRSPGNTRSYNGAQLRRLLNIASLMRLDYKASELCTLADAELHSLIEEHKLSQQQGIADFLITQLIAAGYSYDEARFSNIFAQAIAHYGFIKAYTEVCYPMLERIGILWNADKMDASNEHFIIHLLRQKILAAVDLLPSAASDAETWLLFLPENEFHETGLLIAHYLIRAAGKKSIYLGANLPLTALQAAAGSIRPDKLLFFFVHQLPNEERQQYLDTIASSAGTAQVIAAGVGLSPHLKQRKRVFFAETVERLSQMLS